jgi:6-phospho-3-hexuloisomerase
MAVKIEIIMDELRQTLLNVSVEQENALVNLILSSRRIFVAGAGRSGLMSKCFTMRLMHLGFTAYSVGEVVTPSIEAGDLLMIASGSGRTASLISMAKTAKSLKANVATITIYPQEEIAFMCSVVLQINAPTTKSKIDSGAISIQPMGSLFEQSLLIIMDHLILLLMDKTGMTENEMFSHHANLE